MDADECYESIFECTPVLPSEKHSGRIDVLPQGGFYGGLSLVFKNYKLVAFPGPGVSFEGRKEHLPLHCHVYYPEGELRINCDTLDELDGKKIPKDLRKHLIANKDEICRRTEQVFLIGNLK